MVRISIFKGGRPTEIEPAEVKEMTPTDALEDFVSRLFGLTFIDEYANNRLVIECLDVDARPDMFVLFESEEEEEKEEGELQFLLNVANWYAGCTRLCSELVFRYIRSEIERHNSRPLAPIHGNA